VTAFRDQLALDVSAVFLNEDEFAVEVTINDVTLTAILDDDLTIERTKGPREAEGIFARRRVLHLAAGLITTPVEGQRLTVDGGSWYVEQVSEAEGMLEVTLLSQET